MDTYSSLPQAIKYDPADLTDKKVEFEALYGKLIIYLEYLQSIFFAQRILGRCGELDAGELLSTSFAMVNTTLVFWTQKDRFTNTRIQLEWLVSIPLVDYTFANNV